MQDSMEELCDVSADAHGKWSDKITEHMPGFNEFADENCFVGKVCLGERRNRSQMRPI